MTFADTVGTSKAPMHGSQGSVVYLDLDTVLLAIHQGRRGVELGIQADLSEGIQRLFEAVDHVVVLVDPPPDELRSALDTNRRVDVVRDGLGATADALLLVSCPHDEQRSCTCAKPGDGLIRIAISTYGLPVKGGWYISADQEGVVSGRTAGLHTIRIGPTSADHLSSVHRPDYEARDLLDAANHILMAEYATR